MSARVPRPPVVRGVAQDCPCTPHRPHGTEHRYTYHSCGCGPCLTAHRLYRKSRAGQKAEAAPVRARLELLRERGWPIREIAAETGISANTLFVLLREDRATCNARTARAVMSIPVPAPLQPITKATELDHLLDGGVPIHEAVTRVGWTLKSASTYLYRHGHPRARQIERLAHAQRRAA